MKLAILFPNPINKKTFRVTWTLFPAKTGHRCSTDLLRLLHFKFVFVKILTKLTKRCHEIGYSISKMAILFPNPIDNKTRLVTWTLFPAKNGTPMVNGFASFAAFQVCLSKY